MNRMVEAWLADPTHKLPLPGGRVFVDGQKVDTGDGFIAQLLADGSLVREKPDALAAKDAPLPRPPSSLVDASGEGAGPSNL